MTASAPARVLAEDKGLAVHRVRFGTPGRLAIAPAGVRRSDAYGWLGISEDQLRWLVHTGGPAALAVLDQPDPATEGPTP